MRTTIGHSQMARSRKREPPMAIYRLLKNSAFGPDDIKVLTAAYEDALRTLRLDNRSDPTTEIVAKAMNSRRFMSSMGDCLAPRTAF
jgi:hypothetical protein